MRCERDQHLLRHFLKGVLQFQALQQPVGAVVSLLPGHSAFFLTHTIYLASQMEQSL